MRIRRQKPPAASVITDDDRAARRTKVLQNRHAFYGLSALKTFDITPIADALAAQAKQKFYDHGEVSSVELEFPERLQPYAGIDSFRNNLNVIIHRAIPDKCKIEYFHCPGHGQYWYKVRVTFAKPIVAV